jgi:hypothetical protein
VYDVFIGFAKFCENWSVCLNIELGIHPYEQDLDLRKIL